MYNILWPRMAAAAVRSRTVILILIVCSNYVWGFLFVPSFVMWFLISFLALRMKRKLVAIP